MLNLWLACLVGMRHATVRASDNDGMFLNIQLEVALTIRVVIGSVIAFPGPLFRMLLLSVIQLALPLLSLGDPRLG